MRHTCDLPSHQQQLAHQIYCIKKEGQIGYKNTVIAQKILHWIKPESSVSTHKKGQKHAAKLESNNKAHMTSV